MTQSSLLFYILIYFHYYCCVCIRGWGTCMCHSTQVKSRRQLGRVGSLLLYLDSGYWTQIFLLCSNHPSSLSHFAGPWINEINENVPFFPRKFERLIHSIWSIKDSAICSLGHSSSVDGACNSVSGGSLAFIPQPRQLILRPPGILFDPSSQ